ncbi:hypothetical protein [Mycolicibacterium lutetiense]
MPNTVANNQPFGVCGKCQVLACVGHGVRNGNIPQFQCVICVPALIAASTSALSVDRGKLAQDLRALLSRMGGDDAVIRSVDDFVRSYPDLAVFLDYIDELLQRSGPDESVEAGRYYYRLGDEQRRLLLLAVVILMRLDVNPELLPAPVRDIYRSWM